ncbi:MAG: NAD(P)-binding domain-containing protein [Anaerolineaceae bacterium]
MAELRVGYIGLGKMGKPMAKNILKAGFPTTIYNRSKGNVLELVALGASAAQTPREVSVKSDVVFTNLPDTPDVLEVVFGENGVAEGAHPGMVFVDNSTIAPAASREIYEKLLTRGVKSLDAPVSGGDVGAQQGTLSIMVGGDADALEAVMPILSVLGRKITHVGDAGAGQIAKAANQIMVAAQMLAMSELMIFSQKAGADPGKVIEAIKDGAAQCWTLDVKPQRLLQGNRQPGFRSQLQAKDMAIVMETARQHQISLPGAALSSQLYNSLCAIGWGDLDNSAIIKVIELLNGENLRTVEA